MPQRRFLFVLLLAALASATLAQELPSCELSDLPARHTNYDDYHRTILDTVFTLPADYEPPDLTPVSAAFPDSYDGGGALEVRAVMIADLRAMLAAAEAAGVRLAVQSAYRSYSYQERTFQYWVDREGYDAAVASSARPGHSEHQLGTAVDLRSRGGPPAWELEDWALTPEGAWVAANAPHYGFVMSYPRSSKDVTCYVYEPWHYRYVGRDVAAAILGSGLTPREYLWQAARVTEEDDRADEGSR